MSAPPPVPRWRISRPDRVTTSPISERPSVGRAEAEFRECDPDDVVAGAVACPHCLRTAADIELELIGASRAVADCMCRMCDATWQLGLVPAQARRLARFPPDLIPVSACESVHSQAFWERHDR